MSKEKSPKLAKPQKEKKEIPHENNYQRDEHKIRTITETLGDAVIPDKYRKNITREFTLAGIQQRPYLLYGMIAWVAIALAIITSALLVGVGVRQSASLLIKIPVWIILTPFTTLLFLFIAKILLRKILEARVYARVQDMEDNFPEFLAEVNLNLKAGTDFEQAIARASQEDFGVISEEMRRLTTQVELGFDLERSLEEFIDSYDSDYIQESFELVIISWKTGGDTPKLVDRVVENMKVLRNLQEKIIASVANYKIFILTVTVALAPAMMALAYHVIDLIREITTDVIQVTSSGTLPIQLNPVQFSDTQFVWFSALTLLIVSTFSAFITKYVETGTIRGSAKTVSVYVIASLIAYFISMLVFEQFFAVFVV